MFFLWAAAARADQSRPTEVVGVHVGLGGCYKAGLWTPVKVTLRGGSEPLRGRLSLTVPDGDGIPSRVVTPPDQLVSLLPGKETTVGLCVRFGRVNSQLKAEFQVEGRPVAEKTWEASAAAGGRHASDTSGFAAAVESRELIVCLGGGAETVERAAALGGLRPQRRPLVARLDDLEQLPAEWYGYEGVDALVLSTSQPQRYGKLAPGSPRLEALDQWVQMGGKLVLCVGAEAAAVLGKDAPLARFAPGRYEQMVSLRQSAALEAYCGSSVAAMQAGAGETPLRVPRLAGVKGTIEAREADLPLVIRTARGFGQVVFLAADLDGAPLAQWSDSPLLAARLLDLPTDAGGEGEELPAGMRFGYTDMAGQLRSALDQFVGVRVVPFWVVAGLVVVYILLIGPADYFFLRKIVGRMQWTWLTFPAVVLVFSLAACVLAYWLKGDRLRVNQIDLVDVDAASGRVRGTSWMNVFSPRTESFDLSVEPRILALPKGTVPFSSHENRDSPRRVPAPVLGWLGLPGKGLGGMDPPAASPLAGSGRYEFAPALDGLRGLPIQVWSTRSLTARWSRSAKAVDLQKNVLQADLTDEDQSLVGTITNNLKFPLSKCMLAYDRWAYELETLQPGQAVPLGAMTQRSELRTRLTGRRMIMESAKENYRQEAAVYDQGNSDASYVLRMMMFYEAAGGQRYTGLVNDYQRFADLSELLKTGSAILVGQPPDGPRQGGAELRRDGLPIGDGPQDRHVVLYRFVLPVKKGNP
jgi:hypothetical protein